MSFSITVQALPLEGGAIPFRIRVCDYLGIYYEYLAPSWTDAYNNGFTALWNSGARLFNGIPQSAQFTYLQVATASSALGYVFSNQGRSRLVAVGDSV